MAHNDGQVRPVLSMSDKAHQLAVLLDAILYEEELLEQVRGMYGQDSIEDVSRTDLLIGVVRGARATVKRYGLTPNGIYKDEE